MCGPSQIINMHKIIRTQEQSINQTIQELDNSDWKLVEMYPSRSSSTDWLLLCYKFEPKKEVISPPPPPEFIKLDEVPSDFPPTDPEKFHGDLSKAVKTDV